MNPILKYGLIAAAVGGFLLFTNSDDSNDIDLNAALDVTVDTLYAVNEQNVAPQEPSDEEQFNMLVDFANQLETNYNRKEPALYAGQIGVNVQQDASLLAYGDTDLSGSFTEGEDVLFLIEIDGENSRVIATSDSGVNDHHFSGTGLLAGYLIGSMLSRQGKFGNPKGVAGKQSSAAKQAAKSRAGSGSHSKGK